MHISTGEVLICDNDNVAVNGESHSGIAGTQDFMSPELVMGASAPSADSDRFSLAVLLFNLLYFSHPLMGEAEARIRCLDNNAKQLLFGKNPVYVWDPNNATNRPVRGVHNALLKLENVYPQYIKDLFLKTFTVGLKNQRERTLESEFRKAFIAMYNSVFRCNHCGRENFYDVEYMKANGSVRKCMCGKTPAAPPRIKIDKHIIVADDGKKIFNLHVFPAKSSDISEAAIITKAGNNWFIKNTAPVAITCDYAGACIDILPNKSVEMRDSLKLNFGEKEGSVRK